jgi:pyruvate,water dikinase
MMARLGSHLVDGGVLTHPEQIYFLERAEIVAALDSRNARPMAALTEQRRQIWTQQRALGAPLKIGELAPRVARLYDSVERLYHGSDPLEDGEIRGYPGSPGRISGRARVLRSVRDVDHLKSGEVLVTPVTTPAWTPAFLRAAAVVTDTGSVASHASIVAREYGLPAVVATSDATARIRDGDLVTVDGTRGRVYVLGRCE